MVPVLVGANDHIQVFCLRSDIVNDSIDCLLTSSDRRVNAAVNEHPEITTVLLRKFQQMAVADSWQYVRSVARTPSVILKTPRA